jgi:hypothetical protein
MKKIFQSFAKAEFSKKLAVVVLVLYIVMAIATAVLKLFNYDIIDVFDYVQYAFVIVLSGYVLKAGAENVTKISVSDLFKKSKDTEEGDA